MAYRADGLRAAARTAARSAGARRRSRGGAVLQAASCTSPGPTTDRRDRARRHRRHQARGRHGHPRRAAGSGRPPGQPEPAARHRAADRRLRRAQPGGLRGDGRTRCATPRSRSTSIGVGGIAGISLKGENLLTELAATTGGRAWFPLDAQRLSFAYEAVAADVQHRYLLTYTPTNQRRDGTYRAIKVNAGRGRTRSARARATRHRWRRRSARCSSSRRSPADGATLSLTQGRSRGGRGRRPADRGHVPGVGAAGDDHAGARRRAAA